MQGIFCIAGSEWGADNKSRDYEKKHMQNEIVASKNDFHRQIYLNKKMKRGWRRQAFYNL
jgi:hypothetical protein